MKVLSIDVGTVNLGLCILSYDSELTVPYVIEHWELINLRIVTVSQATMAVVEAFIKRPQCYQVDLVLIESQEKSTENMKRLSNAIQAHFETARVLMKKDFKVGWSSGGVKLRVYEGPLTWKPIKTKVKHTYNKRLGEAHTRAILSNGDANCLKWLKWFETLDKQDDVADSFLQAAYYLKPSAPRKRKTSKKNKPICEMECMIISDDSD